MKFTEYAIVTAILLFGLTEETKAYNCASPVSWTKDSLYRHRVHLAGEWVLINCTVNISDNVTLWFRGKYDKSHNQLHVDNKKIIMVSKNVFNITRLTKKDKGWYICKVCGTVKEPIFLTMAEGKAYAKAIIKKKPNKLLYDNGTNVDLACQAEISTNTYKITWYKLSSNGDLEELKSYFRYEGGIGTEILSLNSLSDNDAGTYKCEVSRPPLHYSASQLVNIWIKDARKVPGKKKIVCGYPGISKQMCVGSGCFWEDGINGVSWCFYLQGKLMT